MFSTRSSGFIRLPYGNILIYFWSFLFSLGLNSCTYYVQYNTNPIGLLHCAIRHYSDYVILLFSKHRVNLKPFFDEGRSTGVMYTSDCNACRMTCYTSSCMESHSEPDVALLWHLHCKFFSVLPLNICLICVSKAKQLQ